MSSNALPVNILMILDGWGISAPGPGNAVTNANTPFLDHLIKDFPHSKLACCGPDVGLPDQTMGNSEVGHMNIGAGRIVPQNFVRINTAIENKTFFENPTFKKTMVQVKTQNRALHLMGLLSDGGVHSHISHLFALMDMAKAIGIQNLYIHPILDGRDTSPLSGIHFVRQVQEKIDTLGLGEIATLTGRFWAMDRDTRWDRVKKAYDLYTQGKDLSLAEKNPVDMIQAAYERDETDEFIKPVFLGKDKKGLIQDGDGVIFFNFRADRAKEITQAFTQKKFTEFDRQVWPNLSSFICMTQYDEQFNLAAAFGPEQLTGILGEVLCKNKIVQLRIAETEKYAHVTYFLNGGDEAIFNLEKRILIPSPRNVTTYDLKPEMSAQKIADKAREQIESNAVQFIILNFANMDMVGHTGIMDAAVTACETVDQCAAQVVKAIWETGGTAFITADHGNSEQMLAKDGTAYTAHTLNPVPFIMAGEPFKNAALKNGKLGDIAPTVLKALGIKPPKEMTGTPLF